MSLKDFVVASQVVSFKGGSLNLRGLSLNDISTLARDYLPEIEKLFGMYASEEQRENALSESVKFAATVVREAPAMIGQLIAMAGDDLGSASTAMRLPLPVQMHAIRIIFEMTFEEAGGAKKFFDSMMGLMRVIQPTSQQG